MFHLNTGPAEMVRRRNRQNAASMLVETPNLQCAAPSGGVFHDRW